MMFFHHFKPRAPTFSLVLNTCLVYVLSAFAYGQSSPRVSQLPFMGEPKRLVTTRMGDVIQVKVDVGLASVLTIQ